MKYFALAAVGFFLMSGSALYAQGMGADTMPKPKNWFTVGPFFTAGADVFSGQVPKGSKTDAQFAFTGGAFGAFNFSPKFAIALGVGYEQRGLYFRDEQSDTLWQSTSKINYFSIQPSLKFQAFMVGVSIGMPLSISQVNTQGPASFPALVQKTDGDLKTLIDVRMGGMIPIMQNEKSDLNFFVQGSYSLTSALKEGVDPNNNNAAVKYPLPTLQLGFCYTFELGK